MTFAAKIIGKLLQFLAPKFKHMHLCQSTKFAEMSCNIKDPADLMDFDVRVVNLVPMTNMQNIRVCFLENTFLIRVPPLNSFKFSLPKRETLMKKVF